MFHASHNCILGGWYYRGGLDTILEYDFRGDTIREIGKMMEKKSNHALSVVQTADFSQWWWCLLF